MADAREVVTLNNGARVVFDPMPGLRTAAVGVFLSAGARHESDAHSGLAHFLEHMAFKGASGLSAQQIAEAVEARGGVINAATGYEMTNYFVRCLTPDAPDMLDLALSMVFAPDHPEGEIEREKGVVLQEMGEALDQPDDLVFELIQQACYAGHPLGRAILGEKDTLKALTRGDLIDFAQQNYSPRRTVVSVAGAFDRGEILARAERWLGGRPDLPTPASEAPATAVSGVRGEVRKLEQCHIVLARPTISAKAPTRFAARIFAEVLGGGMASRLFQQVREARGLAYTIDAACEQHSDAGRVSVYAGCDPGDAADVAKLTADIWADLANAGPTQAELDRAKAIAAAQFAMAAEAPAARAGSAAYELLTFERTVTVEETLRHIAAVTIEDVSQVGRDMMAGPALASAVGPKAGLAAAEAFVSSS